MEEPKSKGMLHLAEKAKAMIPLLDYSGVVVWMGDDHFCLHDSIGTEICCWTLEALILSGFLEEGTTVKDKTEADHILNRIVQRLHEVHEEREKERQRKGKN